MPAPRTPAPPPDPLAPRSTFVDARNGIRVTPLRVVDGELDMLVHVFEPETATDQLP